MSKRPASSVIILVMYRIDFFNILQLKSQASDLSNQELIEASIQKKCADPVSSI